jgi:hypothetical protein
MVVAVIPIPLIRGRKARLAGDGVVADHLLVQVDAEAGSIGDPDDAGADERLRKTPESGHGFMFAQASLQLGPHFRPVVVPDKNRQ